MDTDTIHARYIKNYNLPPQRFVMSHDGTSSNITDDKLEVILHQMCSENWRKNGDWSSAVHGFQIQQVKGTRTHQSNRSYINGSVMERSTSSPLRIDKFRELYHCAHYLSDGHHKLISWRFVTHCAIDGYSSLVV